MSSANGGEPSFTFTERARALLDEGRVEIQRLDARHAELVKNRDAEVARVRERYAGQLAEIADERKVLARLERALDPQAAKPSPRRSRGEEQTAPRAWTPKQEQLDAILAALGEGIETVPAVTGRIDASSTTAKYGIDALREQGLVRLAGMGRNNVRLYRLTPPGRARLAELGVEVKKRGNAESPLYTPGASA